MRSWKLVSVVCLALLGACGSPPEDASAPPALAALLVRGTAHAEIKEWPEALEAFRRAAALAPGEPAAVFDQAVVHFLAGDRAAARGALDRLPASLPPRLAARARYLEGRIAYEDGDREAEEAAYRAAAELDPQEPAYPYALAEARRDDPAERGAFLRDALALWDDNARLASDFALWALAHDDAEVRARGLAVIDELAAAVTHPDAPAYLERGRRELAEQKTGGRVPPPLRVVLNLLLASKRFQSDAAELAARQQPMPLTEPVATATPPPAAEPEVRFEAAELLPPPGLAADERILAVVLVDDADDAEDDAEAPREAGLALLSDRALYFLAKGGDAFERLAEIAAPRELVAGDLDDDGRPELLALADSGTRAWGRGTGSAWAEAELDGELAVAVLRRARLLDFEHDGDLDLAALDEEGRLVLATHRGEAGLGPPVHAPVTIPGEIRRFTTSDLDGDADQDLVAATQTELLVLRNWRQGEYSLHVRRPLPDGPGELLPFDADGDGTTDVAVVSAAASALFRGTGRARLESVDAGLDGAPWTALADVDLDGDLDLWLGGALARRRADGFELDAGAGVASNLDGALALDLDGDRDPDLVGWRGGELLSWRDQGAEGQGWLALRLRGRPGKVPLDGRGVRVRVAFGDRVLDLEPSRANLVVGLGGEIPTVVKATWPNGISEYLFAPAPRASHTIRLTLRIEGSCPFLYASDGDGMRFVTDILGLAPLGMLASPRSPRGDVPASYVPADPEEYLRLPDWVAPRDGVLELSVTEELREVLYLDQAELVAIDAPADVEVQNGERWLRRFVEGLELRLLTPLAAPASVLDHQGRESLDLVREEDHRYLAPASGARRYQGAVAPHRLVVELPAAVAAAPRPVLVLVGWLHWGNTSTNVARAQDPDGAPLFPYLEVPDGAGGWRRTGVEVGLPAGKTKPVVVELGDALDAADPRLRVTTDFEVYWDLVAAASRLDEEETAHRVHTLAPSRAELGYGGFSRWVRPSPDAPYLFDYGERRPYPWRRDGAGREVVLSWDELEGFYTAFGPVDELLREADDRLVVLGAGEEVALSFDVGSLPPLPSGWRRTYVFHSEGWEKDGDPNVACSQTVEPLPYRGMAAYPCTGAGAAAPPAEGARRSRWVGRERLARRVLAWAGER